MPLSSSPNRYGHCDSPGRKESVMSIAEFIQRRPARSKEREGPEAPTNVGTVERGISVALGAGLAAYGLSRKSAVRPLLMLAGAALVHRGVTGRCQVYRALGHTTSAPEDNEVTIPYGSGRQLEESVVIARPASEPFRFWRDSANHPRFMSHVKSVTQQSPVRSHWVATVAGKDLEWDSEVINEEKDR